MEPASLALGVIGLGSLFDTCLKLYEHVSNAKRYPEDCKRQVLFLDLESMRFGLVRVALLQGGWDPEAALTVDGDNTPYSGGSDLQLAHNLNTWKYGVLGRILRSVHSVLTEAQTLVEKYQKTASQSADSKRKLRHFISRLHTDRLSWIAADKNRLKELVASLRELNSYLGQLLPTTSRLRLQLGFGATVVLSADIDRLREIQTNSSTAGYEDLHQETSVRIARLSMDTSQAMWSNERQMTQGFRIYNADIGLEKRVDKSFNIYSLAVYKDGSAGTLNGRSILLERRQAFTTVGSVEAAERRINNLVGALRSMKGPKVRQAEAEHRVASASVDFGVPRCLGWIAPDSSDMDVIDLVYEYPKPISQPPVSLHTLLQTLTSADRPSLGVRFNLALRLAQFYAGFISVGYLHKGLHSHNVLFFGDINHPRLVGCAESRPDIASEYSSPLSDGIDDRELYIPWETIMSTAEPDAMKRTSWSATADIYGLGVILVEIGRWSCASQAWGTASLYDFHQKTLLGLVDELGYLMGDIYRDVAKACLNMDGFGTGSELGVWENYSEKVLKRLEMCRA